MRDRGDIQLAADRSDSTGLAQNNQAVLKSVGELFPSDVGSMTSLFEVHGIAAISEHEARIVRDALVEPVRRIADRGGKGWRASVMLVACEAVGGDSKHFEPYLGAAELLHVGSLIVDDIQDGSTLRRGGPSCHTEFGVPLAINAGTCAYFLFDKLIEAVATSSEMKARMYRLFFECLRAAHAGQALDLVGVQQLARQSVDTGDTARLLEAVKTIHIHKTGFPMVLFLLSGAMAGGASDEVCQALARYGIAMGLAFQIGDDVLNLSGSARGLKQTGEDLAAGKITYPIVVALQRLSRERGAELLERIVRRDGSDENVTSIMTMISEVDACAGAVDDGRSLLDDAWQTLSPWMHPSQAKNTLHAYGEAFLHRHY